MHRDRSRSSASAVGTYQHHPGFVMAGITFAQPRRYCRNLMFQTNKALKSTGSGNLGTAGTASGTNHQEHTTVRTVRSASPVYRIHPTAYANYNPDVFSAWVNHLHSILALTPSHLKNVLDHHCPWVNNCLGQYNYGHFIRFLFYVDVTCSYHVFMMAYRVLSSTRNGFWVSPAAYHGVLTSRRSPVRRSSRSP